MLKPYYEIPNGRLYHGACEDIMSEIETVDLILTDPPYGIGASTSTFFRKGKQTGKSLAVSGLRYEDSKWDTNRPSKDIFIAMQSISKNQLIFGGNYFSDYLKPSSCWIVWDKDNGDNRYSDCELGWGSFDLGIRKFKWRWHGFLKEAPETRYHPTQKPVGLFMLILDKYSKETDLILDPFIGSSTTAIACEHLNRRWIGIEISKEYCKIAKQRITREIQQTKMF